MDFGKSARGGRTTLRRHLEKMVGKFDRTAMIGLVLLLCSFLVGIVTRNSAFITNETLAAANFPACDSFISWLCIPTAYLIIPLGFASLVINLTSFLSTAVLVILGIILVRK